jgi:hypothetical protein
MEGRFTLDFGACWGGAYAALGRYFGTFVVLVVGWFALGLAVWLGTQIAFDAAVQSFPAFAEEVATWEEGLAQSVTMIPLAIVSIFGTVSMVVGWHRRIILDDVPSSPFPTGIGAIFSYLGRLFLAFGIPFIPFFGLAAIGGIVARDVWGPDGANSFLIGLPIAIGAVAAMAVAGRFSIILPAIAVGDRTMTLARAWLITRSNTVKLFFGPLLAALPFSIAGNILEKLLEVPKIAAAEWAIGLVLAGVAVEMMSYASVAGFFSLAYVQFAEALRESESSV